MKKSNQYILGLIFTVMTFNACHDIGVDVQSQLTPEVYPTTTAQFNSLMGPVYTRLRSDYAIGFWQLVSHTTDESVQPAYGGNWFDGGRFMELHFHTWNKDNVLINGSWNYLSDLIGLSNQILFTLESAPEGQPKKQSIAEMKTMRALAYFYMMDLFGNVALDVTFGSKELKPNSTRQQIFAFIESELKAAIPDLSATSGGALYGKPNKHVANALLAKIYLNAQVYTGSARWNEAIAACDEVINAGGGSLFALENRATYFNMFGPNNGPSFKEFIFAIPYDAAVSGNMFHARYDLNRNLGIRYRYSGSTPGTNVNPVMNFTAGNGLINSRPSGPRMTLPEYLANFNDTLDIRNQQWLSGKQYWQDGSPILVRTTKKGYDQFYTGADGGAAVTYHLEFSPTFSLRQNVNTMDCGNDEIAWNMGTRNIKFIADFTNVTNRNQNNDIPIFRLSDIVLMKAEAILRGGTPTGGQTALSLVNSLRSRRTTAPAWTSVTLDDIYAERAREMSWESWRRNDMIRFGKYEGTWGLKTSKDVFRRLLPIPQAALLANPKLVQNPGY